MQLEDSYLKAKWSAPKHVHALTTLSTALWQGEKIPFNLSPYWGDKSLSQANINRLLQTLSLDSVPWLMQVHGSDVIQVPYTSLDYPHADGSWSDKPNQACVVLTADCLPIILTDAAGSVVCALHGGWRGLADGIILKAVELLKSKTQSDIQAWLGPAISAQCFQVGPEVREAFVRQNPALEEAFIADESKLNHYFADLYKIARVQLKQVGINQVEGGEYCTFTEERFFSYRQNAQCGRMATLVWMSSN